MGVSNFMAGSELETVFLLDTEILVDCSLSSVPPLAVANW